MPRLNCFEEANRTRRNSRRGAVIPLMVFILPVLLIFIAFAINVNWMTLKKAEAQSAADLASLSALTFYSHELGSNSAVGDARSLGASILELNGDGPFQDQRIEFGFLEDPSIHNPVFREDESKILAAKIANDGNNSVPMFMGKILGTESVTISAASVSAFQPLEVVLALDASRSMSSGAGNSIHAPPRPGSKWFKLLEVVDDFLAEVRRRNPEARIGLVTFGGGLPRRDVQSPLDATPSRKEISLDSVNANAQAITNDITAYNDLPALGFGTFVFDAIEDSVDILLDEGVSGSTRFIILLTDGKQFTKDISRPAPAVAAERAKLNGIPIHAINLQRDPNPELRDVANVSQGDFFDARNGRELEDAFEELLKKFALRLAD